MNATAAIRQPRTEDEYGIAMRALARKEGHRPGLPASTEQASRSAKVSNRRKQVARLYKEGLGFEDIAVRLKIDAETVWKDMDHVRRVWGRSA